MGTWQTPMLGILFLMCWAATIQAEYIKYKDPNQPVNVRVKDLMKRMTLAEKIGQMTQIERKDASPQVLKDYFIATALEVRATGIPYTFAPCIAVCRDPRWGRCYESYSEDHRVVQAMTQIILGLQGDIPANYTKDFPYVSGQYIVKRVHILLIGYFGICHNSIRSNHHQGFVISDWQGIDRITTPPDANYTYSVQMSVNAGIDMVMVPDDYLGFINNLATLVNTEVIPMSRIDDAVRRILRVKFVMGLFDNPLPDYNLVDQLGKKVSWELAREAVRKSLVLLKNGRSSKKPLLPLPKKAGKILVAGSHADNLGYQCGGWTIEWQGKSGRITDGTTILEAIKSTVDPSTNVVFSENPDAGFAKNNNFSYAIVVVGEPPYSETAGDSLNLTIPEPGPSTIQSVCGAVKCVVVIISGRPVVVEPYVPLMDALVAAWLPGSEGQGVADVLFGDFGFTGKLPRTCSSGREVGRVGFEEVTGTCKKAFVRGCVPGGPLRRLSYFFGMVILSQDSEGPECFEEKKYGSTQEVPLSVPGVLFNEVIDREYDPVSNLHGPRSGVSRLTGYRGGCRWGSWADVSRLTSWADMVLSLA
ncbi:hypothetical protein BHE74_00040982 [Ensete ventricosum]|nr:hypothetical protein BHE74_00040982 [Ensete ventricosum]